MTAKPLPLTPPAAESSGAPALPGVLVGLVGEPFLFARVGYADELSFHFGARREAAHPRLRAAKVEYGTHQVWTRGSAWLVKPSVGTPHVFDGFDPTQFLGPSAPAERVDPARPDPADLIPAGTWVTNVLLGRAPAGDGYALRLDLSSGGGLIVRPTPDGEAFGPDAVADWEVVVPAGTAQVGPGENWRWVPAEAG